MLEGFTRTEIETSGVRIHLRHGGEACGQYVPEAA
jgi:hypothetical protein